MAYAGQPVTGTNIILAYKANGIVTAGIPVKFYTTDTTGDTVAMCDTSGEKGIGIAINSVTAAEATAGRHVSVLRFGLIYCIASAAITITAKLTPAVTTGRLKATTTAADNVLGTADQAAAAGDIFIAAIDGLNPPIYAIT